MNFNVGARIKELRMAKGLSTNKLSNLAGLSQSYVRNLEAGKYDNPTVDSLELICDALGMLSDEQLEGFCQLVNPQKDPDGRP